MRAPSYTSPCIDCGGPKPPQRHGHPRLRCEGCADKDRWRRAADEREKRAREIQALPPHACLICEAIIPRIRGHRGRVKYCSPLCSQKAKVRLQRAARGGVKHPSRAVGQLLRHHNLVVLDSGEHAANRYAAVNESVRRASAPDASAAHIRRLVMPLVDELDCVLMAVEGADDPSRAALARAERLLAVLADVLKSDAARQIEAELA